MEYDVNKLETGFAAEIRWLMDRRLKEEIGIAGIWRRKRQNKRNGRGIIRKGRYIEQATEEKS